MNFRNYYEQEDLMEFSDASKEGVVGRISTGIGNLAGSIYKGISGYFKKAWDASPMGDALNNMKEKGDKAIEVAKIVYPYDKDKYEALKKEGKLKDVKAITSFFTQKVMDQDANYPIGLGIVYRTYDAVFTGVNKALAPKKIKVSMQSLLEAAKKENIRFPQYKSVEEYRSAFQSKEEQQGSQWVRWITTATNYSIWKNKYDNTETENEDSFVNELNHSQLSSYSTTKIQEKIEELESKNTEVNIKTLEDSFGKEFSEVMEEVITKLKAGETYIKNEELAVEENDISSFLKSTLIKRMAVSKNTSLLANIYATTYALIEKNNLTGKTVFGVFASKPSFIQLFQTVKNIDPALLKAGAEPKITPLLEHYFAMNGDGIGKKIKMKPEYVAVPPQKLYDIISTGKE